MEEEKSELLDELFAVISDLNSLCEASWWSMSFKERGWNISIRAEYKDE